MNSVFIYVLKCPLSGEIRYVGKTNDLERRLRGHLKCKQPCYKTHWIQSLLGRGLRPLIEVVDEVDEFLWEPIESAYIQFYIDEGCCLVNSTKGGDAPPSWQGKRHSEETKAKQRASSIGKPKSKEHCEALRLANLGKVLLPEHRKAISDGLMGNQWNVGSKRSEESKAKQSASSVGRKDSRETIAKRIAKTTGMKRTIEQCARMSAAQKKYRESLVSQ